MRISNINSIYTPINFYGAPKTNLQNNSLTKPNALKTGLTTAGAWFGFGIGLDYISRKIKLSKSPTKNSFMINSILAVGAGVYSGSHSSVSKSDK